MMSLTVGTPKRSSVYSARITSYNVCYTKLLRVKAGELVNQVATQVGGKGGGRPDMAMAGGSDVAALDGALASVEGWLCGQLG